MNSLLRSFPVTAQEASLACTDLRPHAIAEVRSIALDEFIHELRQPLSVIDTLAYCLELTAPNEEFRARLQKIQAMVFEANRILERARVDGGEL